MPVVEERPGKWEQEDPRLVAEVKAAHKRNSETYGAERWQDDHEKLLKPKKPFLQFISQARFGDFAIANGLSMEKFAIRTLQIHNYRDFRPHSYIHAMAQASIKHFQRDARTPIGRGPGILSRVTAYSYRQKDWL